MGLVKNRKRIAILTSGWSIAYIQTVLKGIKSVTDTANIDVYLFVCYKFRDQLHIENTTGYKIFSIINYKDFDGVIILGNIFEDKNSLAEEVKRIKKAGTPAISILKKIEGIDYIGTNDTPGFKDLLDHTRKVHHCSDYAYIGGPDNAPECTKRLTVFKEFLKENNLTLKENRLVLNGDYTPSFGEKAAREILKDTNNIPEIIVCINDYTALSVIAVAKEKGLRVPEDIKIIGYDDIDYAKKAVPSISTCDGQSFNLGRHAALSVLKLTVPKLTSPYYPSSMVIRQSCGCSSNINEEQSSFFLESFFSNDEAERFNSQMRHMEDLFLLNSDGNDLIRELSNFFHERHYFEGSTFSMQLKKDYVEAFVNHDFEYKSGTQIDKEIMSVVQIVNDEKLEPCVFKTRDIIPPALKDENPAFYVVFPLVTLDSLIGYIVSKNTTKLLEYKRAYQWVRNLCNHFENFKQKCSYKILSEKYLELSTLDALSGTLNRFGYITHAYKLFDENREKGKNTVICFIDINSMKIINDQFGHLQGDFAIKTVANSIINQLPEGWIAVRYGGDEFVVIGSDEMTSGEEFCVSFTNDLQINCDSLKLPYKLSASCGTKTFEPTTTETLDHAVSKVDALMYRNKKAFHKTL